MSDTIQPTRPRIDSNLLGLLAIVVTIIGSNAAIVSFSVNSLRNEMEYRFEAVDAQFESVNIQFEAVNERFDNMEERIDERFTGIDNRLDLMDGRFDGIDDRLDRVDDRLDRVDDRLDRVDGQLYDLNGRVSLLTERMARVETAVLGYEAPEAEAARTQADGGSAVSGDTASAPDPDPVPDL